MSSMSIRIHNCCTNFYYIIFVFFCYKMFMIAIALYNSKHFTAVKEVRLLIYNNQSFIFFYSATIITWMYDM